MSSDCVILLITTTTKEFKMGSALFGPSLTDSVLTIVVDLEVEEHFTSSFYSVPCWQNKNSNRIRNLQCMHILYWM